MAQRSYAADRTVAELAAAKRFPEAYIIAGIHRPNTDEFEVPRGGPRIQANGDVFLVSAAHDLSKAARFIVRKK